jgi:hypothetical protein
MRQRQGRKPLCKAISTLNAPKARKRLQAAKESQERPELVVSKIRFELVMMMFEDVFE